MKALTVWLIAITLIATMAVEVVRAQSLPGTAQVLPLPTMQPYIPPHAIIVANLYAGPGSEYPIVGTVVPGMPVPIVQGSVDGGWYRSSNGAIGPWIEAAALDKAPGPEELWPLTPVPQPTSYVESRPRSTPVPLPTDPPTSTPLPSVGVAPTQAPEIVVPTEMPTALSSGADQSSAQPFVCTGGCAVAPDGCIIKGNVNSEGERIYHTPSSQYYDRTDIRPEDGDVWFCTVAEAEAAGFRAPLR